MDCEAGAPICDAGNCRACEADDECTSGACDRDTGECIASANVIYVAPSGIDAGSCTMMSPCEHRALRCSSSQRRELT
jgi:hypothetical protein